MQNILFVCTKNKWRSATAEQLYRCHAKLSVRSRGTSHTARRVIKSDDILWADIVFVMENKHKQFILKQFRHQVRLPTLIVLDIPDNYQYMDKELIECLTDAVDSHLNPQSPQPIDVIWMRC